jgi:hypothetical protein
MKRLVQGPLRSTGNELSSRTSMSAQALAFDFVGATQLPFQKRRSIRRDSLQTQSD